MRQTGSLRRSIARHQEERAHSLPSLSERRAGRPARTADASAAGQGARLEGDLRVHPEAQHQVVQRRQQRRVVARRQRVREELYVLRARAARRRRPARGAVRGSPASDAEAGGSAARSAHSRWPGERAAGLRARVFPTGFVPGRPPTAPATAGNPAERRIRNPCTSCSVRGRRWAREGLFRRARGLFRRESSLFRRAPGAARGRTCRTAPRSA
jgi:hypothetical protein